MTKRQTMHYLIGSKFKLSEQYTNDILSDFDTYMPHTSQLDFLDVFGGSGVISRQIAVNARPNSIATNDTLHPLSLVTKAIFEGRPVPYALDDLLPLVRNKNYMCVSDVNTVNQFVLGRSPLGHVIGFLNSLQGTDGKFVVEYAHKRMYFTIDNARKIQAIGDCITHWHIDGHIDEQTRDWLFACLVVAVKHVANTSSVYDAFLKDYKRSALKPLTLSPLCFVPANSHKVLTLDARKVVENLDKIPNVVYIDPPYNARNYSCVYHLLETISRWDLDFFTPQGKTGQRPHGGSYENQFSSKKYAYKAFDELFTSLEGVPMWVFSYNSEGLLTLDQLKELFTKHGRRVYIRHQPYKKFKAQQGVNGDTVTEYLITAIID